MKKKGEFKTIYNSSQKEALINEIKGNLFEYLVAHEVARAKGIESQFLIKFSGEMKSMFSKYESWLRENDRDLIVKLPRLAREMALKISNKITTEDGHFSDIFVIGKMTGAHHNDIFKEADILLLSGQKQFPISLKLCKKNAFVNTKSGGAKSFISKYFSLFDKAPLLQETFNSFIDDGFSQMGHELYSLYDLDFPGRFDSTWERPDLPGELNETEKEILYEFYRKLNQQLYHLLQEFYHEDKEKFVRALMPLLGQGDSQVIQAICFHKDKRKDGVVSRYELDKVLVKSFEEYCDALEFSPLNKEISSFDIKLGDDLLQIRIKPMNKFTTASYKINCSIRYGD